MNRKLFILVLTLLPICPRTTSAQTCHFGGEKNLAATEQALRIAPSCSAAHAYLNKCAWGSSTDVGFAGIVRSKCEKDFIQKLSPAQKLVYEDKRLLCADKFGHQDGTLALSEGATCQTDIAFQFATNLTQASQPLPRASFDCLKAQSPLEMTICANPELGRQDLLMAQAYFPFFKAVKGVDRKTLLNNQRTWNKKVPIECRLLGVPASHAAVSCLIQKYKTRVSDLNACSTGLDIGCVTGNDTSAQP